MSGYTNQIKIDHTKVEKLPWISGNWQYFFRDSKNKVCNGIVYEVSEETYNKLKDRLRGTGSDNIKSGDRVYLMPKCKIPLFKLENHLGTIGASRTNDIEKATFFIGTGDIYQVCDWQVKATSLLFCDTSPEIVTNSNELAEEMSEYGNTYFLYKSESYTSVLSYIDKYTNNYLSRSVIRGSRGWIDTEFKKFFVTPVAISIIYNSILKKIPIVSEDNILSRMSNQTIIDEENYNSICTMFRSEDKTNHDVARELLANCDIDKSIFYLWRLAKEFKYNVTSSRMKNIKLFVQRAEWTKLYGMSPAEFIEYLYKGDYLTKELFKELIAEASKEYSKTLQNPVFKMVLTPSDKYKEYAEEGDVFVFTHPDEKKTKEELILEENE